MKIVLLIILSFLSFSAFAQTGSISGKIRDAETKEELIGATVVIEGTTIGAAANLDGNYIINGLEPGTYSIVCNYISYKSINVENIIVTAHKSTTHDFEMGSAGILMNEFVVVARANKGGNNYILNAKQESATLLDGISAKEITRGGDSDVAGAIKRVTGVTVEAGKYVYVRGLSDRYTKTTLNGAVIPSLDPRRNSVQMDLFPTAMIDNISIYKTFSPELPADFTGGLINISTKDYPEELNLVFSTSLSYNSNATFNDDFATGNTSSTDWLAKDDGKRAIPSIVQNNEVNPIDFSSFDLARQDAGLSEVGWDALNYADKQEYLRSSRLQRNEQLSQQTQSFNKEWTPVQKTPGLNQNYALSVGNKVKLFNREFGFNIGLNYTSKYEYYDDGITGRYKLTGNVNDVTSLTLLQKTSDTRGDEHRNWGLLGNLSYLLNKNNQLGFVYLYNQNGMNSGRYQHGIKPDDDPNLFINIYQTQYIQRDMSNLQLKGSHTIPAIGSIKIDWVASRATSTMNTPDLRVFTNDYTINEKTWYFDADGNDISDYVSDEELSGSEIENEFPGYSSTSANDTIHNISANLYPAPTRYFRYMEEVNENYILTITLPFNKGRKKESKVKLGASYVKKDRQMDEFRFSFISQGLGFDGNPESYFADQTMVIVPGEAFQYLRDDTELRNSYRANEEDMAMYAMVDLKITKKFKLVTGARVETTNISTESLDPDQEKGELNRVDVLPSLNLSFSLSDKMNLKAALTRTLARPTFRELAPFVNYDFEDGFIYVGNTDLDRSLVDNIDLRWELFPKSGEIFSISGFYKNFHSPIEKVINPEAANVEITWKNVAQATLFGLELEARTNLGFINSNLQYFNIGANFTLVKAKTTIDEKELEQIRAQDPNHPKTRDMFGQSPYVVNGYLNYLNTKLGLEANLTYNVSGPRMVLVIQGATPNVYEQAFHSLNLNLSKTIGEHFNFTISANNLINGRKQQTYSYRGEQYDFQSNTIGRTFQIGIRYKL